MGLKMDPEILTRHYQSVRSGFSGAEFKKFLEVQGLTESEWQDLEQRRLLMDRLYQLEIAERISISPEEIAQYYKQNQKLFGLPEQVRASQIVVATEAEAQKISKELKRQRGRNFEDLARSTQSRPSQPKEGMWDTMDKVNCPRYLTSFLPCKKTRLAMWWLVITDFIFLSKQIADLHEPNPKKRFRG